MNAKYLYQLKQYAKKSSIIFKFFSFLIVFPEHLDYSQRSNTNFDIGS
jgi:hypothetical protein